MWPHKKKIWWSIIKHTSLCLHVIYKLNQQINIWQKIHWPIIQYHQTHNFGNLIKISSLFVQAIATKRESVVRLPLVQVISLPTLSFIHSKVKSQGQVHRTEKCQGNQVKATTKKKQLHISKYFIVWEHTDEQRISFMSQQEVVVVFLLFANACMHVNIHRMSFANKQLQYGEEVPVQEKRLKRISS